MEQLSTDFRKEFNLPPNEGVIQNYSCSHGPLSGGTLYISQNYVCFSNGGSLAIKLPFGKINSITLNGVKGFRSIEIKTDGAGVHSFGMFAWPPHCKQAYSLMVHIWKNPPSYINSDKLRSTVVETLDSAEKNGSGDLSLQQRAKVDVETAQKMFQTLVETDNLQNHAMSMLEDQAQTLDRIEGRLDHISDNLKRADIVMKGIESLPYYIFGAATKKEVLESREKTLKNRTIKIPENAPPIMEIEILHKGKDSLLPALIVFDVDKFKLVDPKTDKLLISGSVYSYNDLESLHIRSRHEYMDIKIKKKEPLRIVSAYLQIITNQLHTRCQRLNLKLSVIFENGAMKFDYQDEWLYKIPPPKRGQAPNLSGVFAPRVSSLLTDTQQRRDMEKVEGLVDQGIVIVQGINKKGVEMNRELERQIEQIKGLENKTDALSGSIQNLNTRMDKVG